MTRRNCVCPNCGHRETLVFLDPEEAEEARRRGEPVGGRPVCPICGSPLIVN